MFDRESWTTYLEGFDVTDCAIMDEFRTFFVLTEITPHDSAFLPRTRFLLIRANREISDRRFVRSEVGDFGSTEIAFTSEPEPEFVAVDVGRKVFSYSASRAGFEADLPGEIPGLDPSLDLSSVAMTVARVGRSIFAVGWPRMVYRRDGLNSWVRLSPDAPLPAPHRERSIEIQTSFTFKGIAGLTEKSMVVVGEAREIWHYDGVRWTRWGFPGRENLQAVACAEDGRIFVADGMGSVWVGREASWRKLAEPPYDLAVKDAAWFAQQLWLGCHDGLWTVQDGKVVRAHLPSEVRLATGRIDLSTDGRLLLTAGRGGAAVFDGRTWRLLFDAYGPS